MTTQTLTSCIAALLMSVMIINISCKDKKLKAKKNEAVRTLAVFLNPDSTDANFDILWRVVKDSIIVDTNDVSRNIVSTDSLYYLERRDTMRASDGKPLLDSLGNTRFQPLFVYIPKKNVWDTYINVDSARKRFDPYIKKRDTTAKVK